MDDNKKKKKILDDYQLSIHRFGRISSAIVVLALIAVPLLLTLKVGVAIDVKTTLKAFLGIFSLFGILTIVEFLSYAPIVGAGGLYLCFITGNTINMKLPASISSVKLAGVEPGSKEAEVISLIAVAVSSITTVIVVTIGMIGLSFLVPIMESPQLKPAFANLMPALLGALATPIFLKDSNSIKTASLPSLIAVILTFAIGYTTFSKLSALAMPVFLVIAVLWQYFLYKIKKRNQTV